MSIILLPVFGFLIGLLIISIGGGGGAFYVGILTAVFNMPPAVAASTSLATIIPTTAIGALSHAKAGNVNLRVGRVMMIGALTGADVREICALAAESLALIDGEFVFAVSHMGYLSALIDECGVKEADKPKVIECVRARNAHDLPSAAGEGADTGRIAEIIQADTEFADALALLKSCAAGSGTRSAADELGALYDSFAGTPYRDRIRLDLSIVNDVDYYNGIIFQGYVSRVPKPILSGGRYDGLLSRIGREQGAMGFALNLGELNAFYPRGKEAAL